MNQEINSRIIKTELIKWRELQFIQHEEFKEWLEAGDKKLLQSLVRYQFVDPFKVWENEGVLYCLDGKHRFTDLQKVIESGVSVPDLLPATFIDCTDMKEAAELVLVYSSAYARITQQGLFEHIKQFDLSFDDIKETMSLSSLDLNTMKDWFLPEPNEEDLIGLLKNNPLTIKITFKDKAQFDTAENLIKQVLDDHCPGAYYSVSGGEL